MCEWRASMAGVGGVLAWVVWMTLLRGWRANMAGEGGVLAWAA